MSKMHKKSETFQMDRSNASGKVVPWTPQSEDESQGVLFMPSSTSGSKKSKSKKIKEDDSEKTIKLLNIQISNAKAI